MQRTAAAAKGAEKGQLEQPYPLFDTRENGNGNQGHTYGTQLPVEDKERLLEYLKTL